MLILLSELTSQAFSQLKEDVPRMLDSDPGDK